MQFLAPSVWLWWEISSRYISDYWNKMCRMFSTSENYNLTAAPREYSWAMTPHMSYFSHLFLQHRLLATAGSKALRCLTWVVYLCTVKVFTRKQPAKMAQLISSFFPLHKFSFTIIQSIKMAWCSVGLMICSIHCTKHNDRCLHR